jgi:hypothetical protein
VAVSSDKNPSSFGQPVTFYATVEGPGVNPTGTVTFYDGPTALGSAQTLYNGRATFGVSNLSIGQHRITAEYSGDANYTSSASAPFVQQVNGVTTTTRTNLSSSPNSSLVGQQVTFSAAVTSSSGTPAGTVTFRDGSSVLGTAALNSSGIALFQTSSLTVGTHSITAAYGGQGNFESSTSQPLLQTVNVEGLVKPTVVLTVQHSRASYGKPVTFTATVSYPGGPVPTGSITISDATNGANRYGVAILSNGVGVVTNSTMPPGSYSIVATYGGDDGKYYTGAVSKPISLNIVQTGASGAQDPASPSTR